MRKLIAILLLALPLSSYAQEEALRFRKEAKLNLSFLIVEEEYQLGYSPVLIFKNRAQQRHEFELIKIDYSKRTELEIRDWGRSRYHKNIQEMAFGLRYQFTISFLKEKKVSPFIGAGFSSLWEKNELDFSDQTMFPYTQILSTNAFELIPGFRWKITKRVEMDVSVILNTVVHKFNYERIKNPALPIKNQQLSQNNFYIEPFEQLHTRFGFYVEL